MKSRAALFAGMALFASSVMVAKAADINGINYNRIDLGYGSVTLKDSVLGVGIKGDLKGFGISGSAAVNDLVILSASVSNVSGDVNFSNGARTLAVDTDLETMSLGIGFRLKLAEGVDLVPGITVASTEVKGSAPGIAPISDDSDDTLGSLDLNFRVTDKVQAAFGVASDGDVNTYGLTGLYKFSDSFGFSFGYSQSKDGSTKVNGYTVGVSLLF